MQVEDDEPANIAIESSHTVDIEKFVPKTSMTTAIGTVPMYQAIATIFPPEGTTASWPA